MATQMKQVFFLSGLPRSGSTLLGSLLAQNPKFTVTPTSPLLDLFCYLSEGLALLHKQYTFDISAVADRVYRGIASTYHEDIRTDYVLDKHRGHPKNVDALRRYFGAEPKIICTNRPVAEVLTSYLSLMARQSGKPNFVDSHLRQKGLAQTTENRARCLWENFVYDPYLSMKIGLEGHKSNIHLVSYGELVGDTHATLDGIYRFLGVDPHRHSLENIENACAEEKDAMWGLEGLHVIRPSVSRESAPPQSVLGQYLTDYYNRFSLCG